VFHKRLFVFGPSAGSLFVWLISHQPTVLFSQNKPATNNQPTVLFSHNKSASAISHQPTSFCFWWKYDREQCFWLNVIVDDVHPAPLLLADHQTPLYTPRAN
jgi:hypothetical protein